MAPPTTPRHARFKRSDAGRVSRPVTGIRLEEALSPRWRMAIDPQWNYAKDRGRTYEWELHPSFAASERTSRSSDSHSSSRPKTWACIAPPHSGLHWRAKTPRPTINAHPEHIRQLRLSDEYRGAVHCKRAGPSRVSDGKKKQTKASTNSYAYT